MLGVDLCDLHLWPWPFAWTSLLSLAITPEDFMMIRWWQHSQKGVTDRQMNGQTDRQTDWTIHRATWSQLKKHIKADNITWLIMYTTPTYNQYLFWENTNIILNKWKYMLHSIFQVNLTHELYHMPKYFYLQVDHDVLLLTFTVLAFFAAPYFVHFTSYFIYVAYQLSSHCTHIFLVNSISHVDNIFPEIEEALKDISIWGNSMS